MDPDKLAKWLELAKRFNGSEFWEDIFQDDAARQMHAPAAWTGRAPSDGKSVSPPYPAVELLRGEAEWIVLMELPGIPKEAVRLAISGDRLIVKGEIPRRHPHAELVHTERFSGEFERTVTLPEPVAEQQPGIRASFADGLLEIRIPIHQPPQRSIKID